MNLASDRWDRRCESDVFDSVITSVSVNLDASLSNKVVTESQLTTEAMLRVAAYPITDKRHIPHQIIISWNAKLHGLYITLFVAIRKENDPFPDSHSLRILWGIAEL